MPSIRLAFVCLLALFLAVSVQAQGRSLNDAQTLNDVRVYIAQEAGKFDMNRYGTKKRAIAFAEVYTAASEKMMELAKNADEKARAYEMRIRALMLLAEADVEDALQKLETSLREFRAWEETERPGVRSIVHKPAWFLWICKKMLKGEGTLGNFDEFKSYIKRYEVRWNEFPWFETAPFWLSVLERHNVPIEEFIKEFAEFIQSPECQVTGREKERMLEELEYIRRFAPGTDLKLNGKTLDDKDFNLESLRGKYVWIKFTGTWCGPCNIALPGMLEAYKEYHDKGLEVVSIYVSQEEDDPVAAVKKHVDEKAIPWIILSEEQWKRAGQPAYREGFHPRGVPTMLLVDKEGKLMTLPTSDSGATIAKLAEIFE